MNSVVRSSSSSAFYTIQAMQRVSPLRCFSARPGGEVELHAGKQLSRPSERVKLNQTHWANIVKRFPKTNWSRVEPTGLINWSAAKYEFDGLAKIHTRSYDTNVLVEIRDVRLPASSHHPSFTRLAKHRTHLIAYTHADLIDAETCDKVEQWTNKIWPNSRSIFVDTRVEGRTDRLHHFDQMLDGLLFYIEQSAHNFALTVGCPNVGKSSVLMALLRLAKQRGIIPKNSIKTRRTTKKSKTTKGHTPSVEDVPGKTREITEYLLRDNPKAFFMDVPGITPPPYFFEDRPEAWFGFGATNLLPLQQDMLEHVELQKQFCEYVLHCANRDGVFLYVDKLNLDKPTNDIDECLSTLANNYVGKLDEQELTLKRCGTFLKLYNTGNFGSLVLDDMNNFGWRPYARKREEGQDSDDVDEFEKKGRLSYEDALKYLYGLENLDSLNDLRSRRATGTTERPKIKQSRSHVQSKRGPNPNNLGGIGRKGEYNRKSSSAGTAEQPKRMKKGSHRSDGNNSGMTPGRNTRKNR